MSLRVGVREMENYLRGSPQGPRSVLLSPPPLRRKIKPSHSFDIQTMKKVGFPLPKKTHPLDVYAVSDRRKNALRG